MFLKNYNTYLLKLFLYAMSQFFLVESYIYFFILFCFVFLQESLKKFREEREKLEQSETLKQARQKFVC